MRGEYLQRLDGESTEQHLKRISGWFLKSIDSGIPVLFYMRCYRRTSDGLQPRMLFGHHVAITKLDAEIEKTSNRAPRLGIKFVDSATGRAHRGYLQVAEQDFTAPTFTYRFEKNRALTSEKIRTGRPLLEFRAKSYDSAKSIRTQVNTAHFATFC